MAKDDGERFRRSWEPPPAQSDDSDDYDDWRGYGRYGRYGYRGSRTVTVTRNRRAWTRLALVLWTLLRLYNRPYMWYDSSMAVYANV